MKTTRALLRWLIAASCLAAACCNILYLTGRASRDAAAYGMLALLACWVGVYLMRRREREESAEARAHSAASAQNSSAGTDEPPAPAENATLARLRGAITAAAAALWAITYGMTLFWRG